MSEQTITALEFAEAYARRSGMTLPEMAELMPHREVRPCDCDYELCEGWGLGSIETRLPWEKPGILLSELAKIR